MTAPAGRTRIPVLRKYSVRLAWRLSQRSDDSPGQQLSRLRVPQLKLNLKIRDFLADVSLDLFAIWMRAAEGDNRRIFAQFTLASSFCGSQPVARRDRDLKHRLCEIDGNGRTLHLDFSLPWPSTRPFLLGTMMPHRQEESIPSLDAEGRDREEHEGRDV